jgi:hypothetical protein
LDEQRDLSFGAIGGEEREGGQRGGADREALADRGGRVAGGVQGVGAFADLRRAAAISAMPPALSATGP